MSPPVLTILKSHPKFLRRPPIAHVCFGRMSTYSLPSLKRWSCLDTDPPPIDQIKQIHVYDFDNTLFATPNPNKQLWNGQAIGLLQSKDTFSSGGWWHCTRYLSAVGDGVEKEEPRAWKGWWNESIVDLVRLSMKQRDALTVLLTGRNEKGFAELIRKMVNSKGLTFDMMGLKQNVGPSNERFGSTMEYKQAFLSALLYTYKETEEIRIYEDRKKHVEGFQTFLDNFSTQLSYSAPNRARLHTQVIEVAEEMKYLDPIVETQEVQRMINEHNAEFRNGTGSGSAKPFQLHRQILFTGYLISPQDTKKLLALVDLPSETEKPNDGIRTLANSIMIMPRPAPRALLNKIGGIGKRVRFRVTHLGSYENRVWAARVQPIPSTERIQSETPIPFVVLAVRGKLAKPYEATLIHAWQPLPQGVSLEFDGTVGEKVHLNIVEERVDSTNGNAQQNKSRL